MAIVSKAEEGKLAQPAQVVVIQEQQPPAPPNALNKYVELLPTTDHGWWAGAYNAGATAIFVAFLIAAVAAVIFVGITEPGYLPIAMIGVPMFLPQVNAYIAGFRQKALTETALDQVERGIAGQLNRIPNTEEGVQSALEAINVSEEQVELLRQRLGNLTRMRPLIARYQYWVAAHKETLFNAESKQGEADHAPNFIQKRALQLQGFHLEDRALIEKTYAAYFRGVILNPFQPGDVQEVLTFSLMPMEMRIMHRALSDRFDQDKHTNEYEHFLNYADKTPHLSWEKVEAATIEELSRELFKPKPEPKPEVKPALQAPLRIDNPTPGVSDLRSRRSRLSPDTDEKTRFGIEHGLIQLK